MAKVVMTLTLDVPDDLIGDVTQLEARQLLYDNVVVAARSHALQELVDFYTSPHSKTVPQSHRDNMEKAFRPWVKALQTCEITDISVEKQ